jgi:cytosine/adenosine deaminase-related metal-dependent hydrolase
VRPNPTETTTLRIDAAGLADAERSLGGPVSLWIRRPADRPLARPAHPGDAGQTRVLRVARTDDPGALPADTVLDRTDAVLIPGLVNAHCHLDLTPLGPRPHDPGPGPGCRFTEWVRAIIRDRPADAPAIRAAVAQGVAKSLAGGVVAVGDILGAAGGRPTTAGLAALAESPLTGVGFVEFFGIGARTGPALGSVAELAHDLAAWPAGARIRPGLHPHAPNTVSRPLYDDAAAIAARDGLPISTHLAETREERSFVADASGPQRDLLESMGIWDDAELEHIGAGAHPVEHLAPALARAPFLVAHLNDCPDEAIETLVRTNTVVAYCPRASAYFGAPDRFGPHRFRDLLAAGVNVCLGTDSIVNLDTPDRISPLDDARLLAATTDAPARTLLAMATTHGARALGIDPSGFIFRDDAPIAGVVAVPVGGDPGADPAARVLASRSAPELLLC